MADSVREKILKNIVEALEAIDGQAPYLNNLNGRVHRFMASGLDRPAYPLALVEEPNEVLEWQNATIQSLASSMTVAISVWEIADADGTTKASTVVSNMVADVVLAVLEDPTRGDNAVETHVDSIESNISSELSMHCSAKITVRVLYRFFQNDPTTRL